MVALEFATVDGGNGISLSVRLYKPEATDRVKQLVLVLVHQYSVLGGCQSLLRGMATELARRGYITVTFDMRGAGRSSGRPSLTGAAEVQDVISVCRWAVGNVPASEILLVGSSAGAPIAGSAIDAVDEVTGYVALGYPFGWAASILFGRHNKAVLESTKPKLFVMGTADGFTSVKQLESKLKSACGRVETQLVPDVGHFEMEGPMYDDQMAAYVAEFAESLQPQIER